VASISKQLKLKRTSKILNLSLFCDNKCRHLKIGIFNKKTLENEKMKFHLLFFYVQLQFINAFSARRKKIYNFTDK
jgi:hypothetical protein